MEPTKTGRVSAGDPLYLEMCNCPRVRVLLSNFLNCYSAILNSSEYGIVAIDGWKSKVKRNSLGSSNGRIKSGL